MPKIYLAFSMTVLQMMLDPEGLRDPTLLDCNPYLKGNWKNMVLLTGASTGSTEPK